MNSQFPHTDSIQELAQFWDNHDLTEFEEQLQEVEGPVFERKIVYEIELPLKEAQVIKKLASLRGVDDADLVREWVIEKVRTA